MANLSDYIVKFNSVDTLASVTARGSTTSSNITVGNLTSTGIDDNATSTALTVTDSGIAATLTTASQPNITSVGTLSGFSSTGIDDNATSTAITIDASENVGIGTASPVSLGAGYKNIDVRHTTGGGLTLGDTSNIHAYLFSDNNGVTLQSPGSRSIKFTTGSTERIRIDASGNVGIGTTSPSAKLHSAGNIHVGVEGNSNHSSRLKIINGGSAGYEASLDFCYEDKDTVRARINTDGSGGRIEFHTFDGSLAERMRIDSSGNVGIGTTSPSSYNTIMDDLVIARSGDSGITIASGTTSEGSIAFADGTSGADTYRGWINYNHNSNFLRFATNASVRLYIDSAGKIGVGSQSPSGSFHVTTKDASGSDVYYVAQNTTSNRIAGYRVLDESGAASLQMQYDNGGNAASISNPNNGALSIYLGGTVAANALDVYEEGTHTTTLTAGSGTPTIASTEDSVGYTVIGDSVFITGQLGTINCSGCSGTLSVTMPFVTKTNTDRSDFYQIIGWTGQSGIAYFVLSQNGGGSSTFSVSAIKTDGSYDTNVATLMASAGTFNINIVGGLYKKS